MQPNVSSATKNNARKICFAISLAQEGIDHERKTTHQTDCRFSICLIFDFIGLRNVRHEIGRPQLMRHLYHRHQPDTIFASICHPAGT